MRYISLEEVLKLVSMNRNQSIELIKSSTRKREVRESRQMCHYLMEKWTLESLEDIATYTGLKNHSTVIHSYKTVANDIDYDDEIKNTILDVEDKIKSQGFTLPKNRKLNIRDRKVKTIPSVKYALGRATMQELLNEISKRYEAK